MAEKEVGLRLSLRDRQQVARGLQDTSKDLDQVADSAKDVGPAGEEAARGLTKATDGRFARGFAAIGRGAKGLAGFLGRGLVTGAKAGAVGLAALTIAAGGLSAKAIALSGDAAETASAFSTVFGPAADRVGGQLDKLINRFGLYGPELQDATRQFGVFAKAAGLPQKELGKFSTSLTKAGLDLGSFYNADSAEVFQAFQSGLSGEAEPLKRFGIFVTDAAMKAQAASMGLTGTLTEQQKVMVRQRLIMDQFRKSDAYGDLAKTAGGYANQQREAENRTKTFATLLGGPLKTAITGVFRGFNSIAKVGIRQLKNELPGLNQNAEGLSKRFARWGRQMARELPTAIETARAKWDAFKGRLDALKGDGVSMSLGSVGDALGKIGTSLAGVDWGAVGTALDNTAADTISIFGVAIAFAADHIDTLAQYMPWLVAGFVAYKTAQAAANVVALLSVPIKIAEIAATRAHTTALRANTATAGAHTAATKAGTAADKASMLTRAKGVVGLVASKVAMVATTVAQKAMTAGQWLLNAALTANPIGLVVAGIAALVAGFVLLYKKSDTFRGLVNGLWNNVLKPFGKFIAQGFVGYIKLLAKAWLTMGIFGIRAFRWLLTAAFQAFDGILAAAEKGLGWIPGIGGRIRDARAAFNEFGDKTVAKLIGVENALESAKTKVDELGRKKATPTVTVTTRYVTLGSGPTPNKPIPVGPGLATGGPVRANRAYLVGERGPELVRFGGSGRVIPSPATKRALAPQLSRPAPLRADGVSEIDAALDIDSSHFNVGPAWPGGPITIQVVLPNGKVLGEAVLDDLDDRMARR